MTSSRSNAFRNVPPPPGSKAGTAYTRFIPREELGDFASWKPGSFTERRAKPGPAAPAAPQQPAAPTELEWQQRIAAARQAGYQDGYRDGMSALESFKQSFAQQMAAQVGQVVQGFDREMGALEQHMAASVARIATQLARQIVRSELATRA